MNDNSSEAFLWVVFATCLFPLGIPAFMYLILRMNKVPRMAQNRTDDAVLLQV